MLNKCLFCLLAFIHFSITLIAENRTGILIDTIPKSEQLKNSSITGDTLDKVKVTLIDDADEDSLDNTLAKSHFQPSITYLSNSVYLGRQDSSVLPLLTPQISYIFKSGFEIDFSVGINVRQTDPQVNSWTLAGLYNFSTGNYNGSATLSWYNYSVNSGSPDAEKNGSIAYTNSYNFDFISPSLGLTWVLASKSDFQLTFALDHEFDFLEDDQLNVTPTVTMNASTQNVYNSYYKNKRFGIPRPGKPALPPNVTITGEVINSGQFQIMDYEFSAPVNYTAGKWTFNFTPTEAIPMNAADILLTYTINNNKTTKEHKEVLPNTFYFQVGVTYTF